MAIVVEHDKRRYEILEKALDVFTEEGFEDATFQKIADRCGITRTTLYIYFRNKREIFLWSIKQLTNSIEEDLLAMIDSDVFDYPQKLETVLHTIIDRCVENQKLFTVVLSYLLQAQKSGKDPNIRVRRRTIRLRHLLNRLLIAGKNAGQFRITNIKAANDLLYGMIEACIFHISVLNAGAADDIKDATSLAIQGLSRS